MNLRPIPAAVLFIACLVSTGPSHANGGPATPSGVQFAQGSPAGKDLSLFFEEQDLVTATKRPTSLRKAPAIATIITADEIRNMGARNLLDVLKTAPGLGISVNEFGANMIEVRGIRTSINEKILFMIDGHSL